MQLHATYTPIILSVFSFVKRFFEYLYMFLHFCRFCTFRSFSVFHFVVFTQKKTRKAQQAVPAQRVFFKNGFCFFHIYAV